jgi:hypothetical protein
VISEGTLDPEDLIPRFREALRTVDPERAGHIDRCEHLDADEKMQDFAECLNDYVPPYCYFGSHWSDGARFGVWPDCIALETDAYGKGADILKLKAGEEWPDVSRFEYVVEVTGDGAGGLTLFKAATRKEEWTTQAQQ